ncbi:hypothetical protein GIB67_042676 [Kingdonia uniflora]|uniref:Uncharacterized protein n=1 Tax=Kingdonia uniflora TaxID=39325 RepID=A0A7J7P270_9MAGN|nr:hypothetical protein GIB67_042676 [Kingdonia uniflora]
MQRKNIKVPQVEYLRRPGIRVVTLLLATTGCDGGAIFLLTTHRQDLVELSPYRGCFNSATKSDLIGEDGIIVATERIHTAAGSPNLKAYDTNFGWGNPKKVKIASISDTGAISLAERSDGEVEVEVGLALKESEMDDFASIFADTIKSLP